MDPIKKAIQIYRKELILGPIGKLLEAIIEVTIPLLIAYVMDHAMSNTMDQEIKIGLVLVVLAILGFGIASMSQYYAAKASQGLGKELRHQLFQHILKIPNATLEKTGSATLVNRLTNDIFQIEMAIAMWIRLVVRVPFICLASLVMIAWISGKIALMVLGGTILFSLILACMIRWTVPFFQKANQFLDRMLDKVKGQFINMKLIRSFVAGTKEEKKFQKWNQENYHQYQMANVLSAVLSPITTLILNLVIVWILWYGQGQIQIQGITQGELVAIISYVTQIVTAVVILSNLISIYTKAFSSLKRVEEVWNWEEENKKGLEKMVETSNLAVLFQDVSFSYAEDKKKRILSHFDLAIEKGEVIGIIGPTGAGKSTILQLINRSYPVTEGHLYLFGTDISIYSQPCLKRNVRMMEQNPSFITGSIEENLTLCQKIAPEKMQDILYRTDADDVIRQKNNGLQEMLYNNGANLSGGQRQRLALARTLLGNGKILLLDHVTSALDLKTEQEVIKRCIQYGKEQQMTIVIASQRISTVQNCDRVLVLDNGTIIGLDTHENLKKNCPFYQKMCRIQEGGKTV